MKDELKPVFGDDGTFWMCYADFLKCFRNLNVCKVAEWHELRVKGEFTKGLFDSETQVRCKSFYELTVTSRQKVLIGIHQEDERIQEVIKRKPYIAVGIAILKKLPNNALDLQFIKDFSNERQVELEIELDEGEYIILPRTTGCGINRPPSANDEGIRLLGADGNLHPMAELAVRDIFRRLDKAVISNSLDFEEFQEFYGKVGVKVTESEFKTNVMKKFCHSSAGSINRRGFSDFWIDIIKTKGEETAWKWLAKWGYDRDLYPIEARCFMFTIHSLEKISINMVPQ